MFSISQPFFNEAGSWAGFPGAAIDMFPFCLLSLSIESSIELRFSPRVYSHFSFRAQELVRFPTRVPVDQHTAIFQKIFQPPFVSFS